MTAAPPAATYRPARGARRRTVTLVAVAALPPLLSLAGPLIAPHRLGTPVTSPFATPGDGAVLGGDLLGRDVLSRVLHGGTPLILGALLVATVTTAAATLTGSLAVLRPRVGRAVERAADVAILLPPLLGIMLIALAWPGGGRWAVIAAAVVLGTPYAVRVVAASAAPLATAGWVEAALGRGESTAYIALREILPNLRATVLTLFGLRFVEAVYVISMAGFLQIGPQPPASDWSLMVRENAPGVLLNPWAVIAPGLAIALLAVTVNLVTLSLAPDTTAKAVHRA
ncbi:MULTISPECIES: ABC transporter permease [Streptomyces]|uniref:ABC transporter permease subunit n=1 Tax=Streptomyces doudnae TaxID=3075536 RepID=A0ABD5ETZ5_9ACTN|nr:MULTISPECIES: ABC transporter permease subunit [unclassified Streptomyces]MDT0438196.1 ABC transporter permease subunit [Streptomyces sp. DSM 41981]MYQ67743.1 ABC transporter permease subunit [Streptomyces sp. SID4950]SCE39415.1 peptide/nickel transport system permease protein [Streptomyces sp. SolWspMP-5a-2]